MIVWWILVRSYLAVGEVNTGSWGRNRRGREWSSEREGGSIGRRGQRGSADNLLSCSLPFVSTRPIRRRGEPRDARVENYINCCLFPPLKDECEGKRTRVKGKMEQRLMIKLGKDIYEERKKVFLSPKLYEGVDTSAAVGNADVEIMWLTACIH